MTDGVARGPSPESMTWRARVARGATVGVGVVSRRLHLGGGSVIGGRVGLVIDPRLLAALGAGRRVALVSGTNGKTTTTRLLATALGGPARVATSPAGANLPAGLVAALAAAAPRAPAVLEVDEGYLGPAVAALAPEVVVLLNLSRDQLDRVNEVRMVASRWRAVVTSLEACTVVANADDPLVAWAAQPGGRVVWVAAGQRWRADAVGCPACEGRLVFADDGDDWWCSCGFRRPEPSVVVDGGGFSVDGRRVGLSLALPGECNRSNAAMAAAAARALGVGEPDAVAAMEGVCEVEGRFAVVSHGGVRTRLLLAKNPAGWAELLDMVEGGTDPVVVGINARIADGRDPSWLWDVPFERLRGRTVVATGERCRDLAVRLSHAGVSHRTEPDQLRALTAAGSAAVEYAGNYTAFQGLRRRLAGRSHPGRGPTGPARPEPAAAQASVVVPRSGSAPVTGATGPKGSALRVVVVHPDLLGTYGDGGNGLVLAGRAAWRGIPVELVPAPSDRPLPESGDLYCLGGGEDGPQAQAAELLRSGALARAVGSGATVFAVCAGYQVVGTVFPGADGRPRHGVGLLDVATSRGEGPRAVGELLADPRGRPGDPGPGGEPWPSLGPLTGFENHGARTRVGPGASPLAVVRVGVGNGTAMRPGAAAGAGPVLGAVDDGAGARSEGAWSGRVIGTYLHGPALARNPALADLLLALATGTVLAPLDDDEERALRAERLVAVHPRGRGRARNTMGGPVASVRRLVGARRP